MLIVLIPLIVAPLIILGRRVRKLSRKSQDRIADTSGIADETLNAIQTVQAFTLEKINTERFDAAVEDSFGAAVRRTRSRSTLTALATMLVFGAITFVLWMGAHAVVRGEMTGGQLGQFLLYAGYVGIAAASLSEMWGEVQRAAGAMERLIELENAQPTIQAPCRAGAAAGAGPRRDPLRARDVPLSVAARGASAGRFRPRRARPARRWPSSARRARARARPSSCCCASTTRQQGRILIDGVDIAQADPLAVRARIGLVPQDTVLFARERAREHPLRPARRDRRGGGGRGARGGGRRLPRALPRGLRHLPRRARHAPVGRPAPAHRHRPRDPARPADPAARRGHQRARRRERAAGAGARSTG